MPHEPLSTLRQLELLRDLQRLANRRHAAEQGVAQAFIDGKAAAEREHKLATDRANKAFQEAKQANETGHQQATERRTAQYEADRNQLQEEYRRVREEIQSRYTTGSRNALETQKQAKWQALAVFDADKNNPRESLDEYLKSLAVRQAEFDQVVQQGAQILRERHLWQSEDEQLAAVPRPEVSLSEGVPLARAEQELEASAGQLNQALHRLFHQRAGQLFEGAWPFGIVGLMMVLALVPLGVTLGCENVLTYVGGLVGGGVLAAIVLFVLWRKARSDGSATFREVHERRNDCYQQIEQCAVAARENSRRQVQQLIDQRDTDLRTADDEYRRVTKQLEMEKARDQAEADKIYPPQISSLRDRYQTEVAAAEQAFQERRHTIAREHEQALQQADQLLKSTLDRLASERSTGWQTLSDEWHSGFAKIQQAFDDMRALCAARFPDWNEVDYATWTKPTEPVPAIQFGEATLDLGKVKHAISSHDELVPPVTELKVPTLLTLLEQPSLVVSGEGEGRTKSTELLQTMMVRFLTAMPPGKVRFTICDPLGLGESFSSFMHLADYDEGLIHGRIWSESRDIEQQLARLTNHMETILQKYLRNEYENIHEYNAQAGEVAEPFQVLCIANFPHGFNDATARRLLNLVSGGPRCGIYVLLSRDEKQRLPNDFPLDDLLAPSVHLTWNASARRFAWRYPAFEQMPLALPEPIDDQKLVRLMKQAGEAAKDSIRVEVPFEVVAPEPEKLWQEKCDSELRIPIGRTGANRLHYVRLGKGTSQHLLVAGKTGSGKSTFLHALVTSGALHYSPSELEFYLVDFKKGVEFKAYATHRLPHARVIAIESEREFGLSVLERLDNVLRERGEKFRDAGVQNLADYRAARPQEEVPRVLLIVDEFQELFVEDDRLAQQAGLLLDRLVRQGRAFGMHVLLGSQTLAGAYSLARSTLGQMAIRVALQCSEADAHLILSDERNQAARFLSRPGEAIYNDQNGLVTANQPFQVVWLSDHERAEHLQEVSQLAEARGVTPEPPIVFEGNAPADPRQNRQLAATLSETDVAAPHAIDVAISANPFAHHAWLGSAVSIKPPTFVTFARHGGSNLMLLGQQGPAAMGIMTTAAIALAAQAQQGGEGRNGEALPSLLVLDGTRPGEPGEEVWPKVVGALGEAARLIPTRDVAAIVARVADELARRDTERDEAAPSLYLIIYNGARFREFRKGEDDFSFSVRSDKPAATDKQLGEILKNGPAWGIHTLLWCDGYNAVTRLFDRMGMREFEIRIALQMSAADSSNFIDTPAASQLSPHRALLYNDETGQSELFRPYGLPSDEWLAEVAARFGAERRAVG